MTNMTKLKTAELRKAIDRLDSRLTGLIQKRIELAVKIGRLKKENGKPIEDRKREKQVLRNWESRAVKHGLDKRMVKKIARLLVGAAKTKEQS
ncbi:MAG: chorismate mutase, chorismate mutase [Candidatus Gottesmanbacteria bacterium GW2011_GWA2_43_14]|uniref:Chorismate mutase, chorismate mutase n=1 Tax=Candidatus Gottesmanbacteria bacterium GW2011_GWA2_43_14 TaxID=1618443 RepID=A0A0G1FTL9_9BACT|nr:MAG: chorismate mutase, chorismate mutase [Candidatus Gottesmanbacteria bacterium GW2011_GWA2_43_14]